MVRPNLRRVQVGKRPYAKISERLLLKKLWKTGNRSYPGLMAAPGRLPHYNVAVPFVIRDFRPEDLETLWRIDQECFAAGIAYSRQELKIYVRRKGSFTIVAEEAGGDEVAGFLVAQGGLTGHIITIDVIPEARRSGVGSRLLRAAEERSNRATINRFIID